MVWLKLYIQGQQLKARLQPNHYFQEDQQAQLGNVVAREQVKPHSA